MRLLSTAALAVEVLGACTLIPPIPPRLRTTAPGSRTVTAHAQRATLTATATALRSFGPACDAARTTQTVSFVHVSDLHGSYEPPEPDGVSPYALLRGYYAMVKAQNPYTLFTSGGDEFEKGSLAEQLSSGLATLEMTHAMQFDVRVIGNHDFAWSEEQVLAQSDDPHALVLSTNVRYHGPTESDFKALSYVPVQVGCVRIGFFGLNSGPWNARNEFTEENYYPNFLTDLDYVSYAKDIVASHRSEVDLLVMVSHIGEFQDLRVAGAVAGIDLVLGAHSHTVLTKPDWVDATRTLVIRAGAFAEYATRIDVTVDLRSHAAVDLRNAPYVLAATSGMAGTVTPDAQVQEAARRLLAQWAPNAQIELTRAATAHASGDVGRITARAAIARAPADAALVDLATVADGWAAGPLTEQKFLDTFVVERQPPGTPGFNSFYLASVRGDSLQKIAAAFPDATTGWVFTGPVAIDPAATYTLALQKRTALYAHTPASTPSDPNPAPGYLPGDVVLGPPMFESEVWQILAADRLAAVGLGATDGHVEEPLDEAARMLGQVARCHHALSVHELLDRGSHDVGRPGGGEHEDVAAADRLAVVCLRSLDALVQPHLEDLADVLRKISGGHHAFAIDVLLDLRSDYVAHTEGVMSKVQGF